MKLLKQYSIPILTLLLVFTNSCSTDDEVNFSLPPITETGANTFGCYINGQLLVPRNGSGTFNSADPGIIFWGSPTGFDYEEIDVHDFASERTGSINLHLLSLRNLGEGSYTVNESNCEDGIDSPIANNIFCRVFDYEENIYKRYCSYNNSGNIVITRYDTINNIISGTFNFRAKNIKDSSDEIEITDGRFDLKWDTVQGTDFP